MPNIDIRIKNLPDIKKAFAQAPSIMAKELNIAIREAVLIIGRQSRLNTPVDTGRLRASTYERFGNLQGQIGTNTEYDLYVHSGTRFMKARPYLKNAVESNEQMIQGFFGRAVQRTLDQIGKMT